MTTEQEIIDLLQGKWESSDKKVAFTISGKTIHNFEGVKLNRTFIFLSYLPDVGYWQIKVPHFLWSDSFIEKLDSQSLIVYSYDNSEEINFDEDNRKLIRPGSVYEFNRPDK